MPQASRTVLSGRPARHLAAVFAIAVLAATCIHDAGDGVVARPVRAVPAAASDTAVGVDLGTTTVAPMRELAVAGASLPRRGALDLTVAFLAFTTAAPADDADGAGTPLDRSSTPPTDTNGAADVFLAAVVDNERTIAGQAVPTAFTQGIAPIMRDPRCVRCHSFHYPGGWRENGHVGNLPAGSNDGCAACHSSGNVLVPGIAPQSIVWTAPDPAQDHSPTFDFRGKTDRQLYDQLTALADPKGHMQHDERILWAIAHGRVPFRPQASGGRVPMEPQQWQNLIEGWALAGFPFSPAGAVDDVLLVSRRNSVNTAGNGASSRPSVAFVANPAYDPANPTAQQLGTVYVAFASTATNLIANATGNRNVFRASFEAWLLTSGKIDLRAVPGANLLVSQAAGGGSGNRDSDAPVLDGSGRYCAFESAAGNLVAGYLPDPTAVRVNVYLRDFQSGSTTLVSHAVGTANQSGDGDSRAAAIAAVGEVVAFDSDADNLVAGDTNGRRDVFYARRAATPNVQRASRRSGGDEATGGDSTHATVYRDPIGDVVWVAFESLADFGGGVAADPAIWLHREDTGVAARVGDGRAAMRQPAFTPDGGKLAFVSSGAYDGVRADGNGIDDVQTLDFVGYRDHGQQSFARSSIAVTGADADGASGEPVVGAFRRGDGSYLTDQLIAFTTQAGNVGGSSSQDAVVSFALDRRIERVVAEFTAEVTRGVAPFAVQFGDLSNNAVSWSWDFGDGETSTEQNPTHTYLTSGTYTVQLTVAGTVAAVTTIKAGFVQVTDQPLLFQDIHAQYLTTCAVGSGCHSSTHASGTSNFSMATATTAYNNMVNVNSVTGCAPLKRVAPGDADNSVLLRVTAPVSQCANMPTLSPQARRDIVDWIEHGVPR